MTPKTYLAKSGAVNMWEQSKYWTQRAAASLNHAERKERPDVRARRIKKIEADLRKVQKQTAEANLFLKLWNDPNCIKNKETGEIADPMRRALWITNSDYVSMSFSLDKYPRGPEASQYEGPMALWSALDGGIITPEQAQALAISAHERSNAHRARWIQHYENRLAYERAMLAEDGGTAADKVKPEKGGACRSLWGPRNGWAYIQKVNKVTVTIWHKWQHEGRVFKHNEPLDKLREVMSAAQVAEARAAGKIQETEDRIGFYLLEAPAPRPEPREQTEAPAEIQAMQASLKAGVSVVSAPQLFPTPPDVARRMVQLAGLMAGQRILEPSAGTGELIRAAVNDATGFDCCKVVAVEINGALVANLEEMRRKSGHANGITFDIRQADFLQCNGDLGTFGRILMNPPFKDGADIKHIQHARAMLKPGGRLVAICANGPRQQAALKPLASNWEELPAGTFAGTGVRAALLTIDG